MSTANSQQGFGSGSQDAESFPRFSTGNVLINLSENENDNLKLHKAVLIRNLSWFKTYFSDIDSRSLRGNDSIYKLGLKRMSSGDLDLVLTEVPSPTSFDFTTLTSGRKMTIFARLDARGSRWKMKTANLSANIS